MCTDTKAFGYAFNGKLSRAMFPDIKSPATLPFIYDSSNLRENANDAFASLPSPGRHDGKNNVLFADGKVKAQPAQD